MRDFLILFVHMIVSVPDWQGRAASVALLPNPR
jgi:hypothetical protein